MKDECTGIETSLSYYRRLAQGRIEILDAELERRAQGGTVEDLIAKLPEILAGDGTRPTTAQTRIAEPGLPAVEIEWPDNRQQLVNDSTLTELPSLDDSRVTAVRDRLRDFEHELSDVRAQLHGVLDGIEREIATRQAAGSG